MKVEVKKIERGEVQLTIEIGVEEYKPFLNKAAEHISTHTKIAGFRPGKANLDVVIKTVGEGRVWEEALESAVQKTFVQALDQEKLVTIGSPHIDVVKLAPGNPVIYTAKIATLPEATLPDYKNIKVEKKDVKINDEDVKKVLEDLQRRRAKETLASRDAKKGDKLEIDLEVFVDNVPVEGGAQKNFPLIIGEGSFIPGFEDNLIGLKKDDTKEFKLAFPKDYYQKNLAGKEAEFKVKVRGVYNIDLPGLNDEFAKDLGGFKTVDELKKQIQDNLTHEAEHKEAHRLEEDLMDRLIEQTQFTEIPDVLVSSETKKMMDELTQNLGAQNIKLEDYLTHMKKTKDELMLEFVPQAIKRVKGALITRAVSQQQGIKVEDAELEDEIKKTLEAYGGNEQVAKQINTPEYKNYVRNIIAARKTMQHLKDSMVQN